MRYNTGEKVDADWNTMFSITRVFVFKQDRYAYLSICRRCSIYTGPKCYNSRAVARKPRDAACFSYAQ